MVNAEVIGKNVRLHEAPPTLDLLPRAHLLK
jgi:hypothetical protein